MLAERLHIVTRKFEDACLGYPHTKPMSILLIKERYDLFLQLTTELAGIEQSYRFQNSEEEISYFKSAKPEFYKYGVYYERILDLESHKPLGDHKYYSRKRKSLTEESVQIMEFLTYYRTGGTLRDEELFIKTANHRDIYSLIKALEMLEKYLDNVNDKRSLEEKIADNATLRWTGTQAEFAEMVNSLQLMQVLNNGEASTSDISEYLSTMLNVEITDIHKSTHEIMQRKEPARFMLKAVEALRKKQLALFEKIYNKK